MLDTYDQERVIKSEQSATLLVQDLQELVRSSHPLLADIALELLQHATQIERRLNRVRSFIGMKEKAA